MKPALILFILTLAVGVSAGPASATPPDPPALAVEPSVVRLPVSRGETLDISLAVRNPSDGPVHARVAAVAATTAGNGGVGYLHGPDQGPSGWIDLDRGRLALDPAEVDDVVARVTVPDDARAGDHIAGVAVWAPVEDREAGEAPSDELSARIRFRMRQIVPVVLTVPGGLAPELRATELAISESSRLSVAVANRGDLRTGGTGRLRIPALGVDEPFTLGTVLPRSTASVSLPWRGAIPAGHHAATVDVTDRTGHTTRWTGALVADAPVSAAEPEHGGVQASGPAAAPTTAGAVALGGVVPMVVAGLVGALAVVGTNRVRRRRAGAQDGA